MLQKNGLIAVDVVFDCGVITPEKIIGLTKAIEEFGAKAAKLTTRETMLVLLDKVNVDPFKERLAQLGLKESFGTVVRAVKSCSGNKDLCNFTMANALDLGIELQNRYLGQPTPRGFKIATAGCARACTDPFCADLGLVASGQEVYDVIIGGRGGSAHPIHGTVIARKVAPEKIFPIVDFVLDQYRKLAEPKEKLCQTINRVGLNLFTPPEEIYSAPNYSKDNVIKILEEESQPKNTDNKDYQTLLKKLETLCNKCDKNSPGKCEGSSCLIGFSKSVVRYCDKTKNLLIPGARKSVPITDLKVYYPEDVAPAIAETCRQCRECRDNHSEDCVFSLVRACLESTSLSENIVYPGSIIMYLAKIKALNPELGENIARELAKLRKSL